MTLDGMLDDSFARDLDGMYQFTSAAQAGAPQLVMLNTALAAELGLDAEWLASPAGIEVLVGNAVPAGARPLAQAYSGHQFGGFSSRLGDGRALLLGELRDVRGELRDLHLKGSGRTAFSRGGDGYAAVGPMLREYLMGEAMHALGIPTTRALAVVSTGDQVARDTMLPGAVLARVAASHLRVGTFQYASVHHGTEMVQRVADFAIARHYPQLAEMDGRYLALLEAVTQVQAELVANWMLVGFVHGVMNTDNTTISGETIDYGPCAFMDRFDPATVFSSIDHNGRYAYGNQPSIVQWNLARLAETLLPLIDDESDRAVELATAVIHGFVDRFNDTWLAGMRAKLGLVAPDAGDTELVNDLLELLHQQGLDFTGFFRSLSTFEPPPAFDEWTQRWTTRLRSEGRDRVEVAVAMNGVNPIYIPRNHLVEEALTAGQNGDLAPLHRLLAAVTEPFEQRAGFDRYAEADLAAAVGYQTFCGT
ncbi:MAG TPA: YdiU family protein [Ilumatobacteraceae bacterium]|nr:YdiU family protein [Ilumatobacteraceae bacterium]HRB03343.1 YdiU family protein [Ilumatobacteraceae bacterium]